MKWSAQTDKTVLEVQHFLNGLRKWHEGRNRHQVVIDNYLDHHESPEDIEVYFCGPPLMNQAVEKMAEDFGVPDENVRFDDFGG